MKPTLPLVPAVLLLLGVLMGCQSNRPALPSPGLAPYTRPALPGAPFRLALLGDSISSGVNSDFSGQPVFGWADFIRGYGGAPWPVPEEETLEDLWPDGELRNFAISGSTAYQWSFEKRYRSLVDYNPHIAILFIGGNDLLAAVNDGVFDLKDQEILNRSFNTLLDGLKARLPDTRLVLVGYYDLFDGQSRNLPFMVRHLQGLSDQARLSNALIRTQAQARGAYFLDLEPVFRGHGYGPELGLPGPVKEPYVRRPLAHYDIHPNTAGHRAIARAVLALLKTHAQDLR